jgi:hypothetical protein
MSSWSGTWSSTGTMEIHLMNINVNSLNIYTNENQHSLPVDEPIDIKT